MKAAVAIDEWKLSIFEHHLSQAGYSFERVEGGLAGAVFLRVTTDNPQALGEVVMAAEREAKRTGAPLQAQGVKH